MDNDFRHELESHATHLEEINGSQKRMVSIQEEMQVSLAGLSSMIRTSGAVTEALNQSVTAAQEAQEKRDQKALDAQQSAIKNHATARQIRIAIVAVSLTLVSVIVGIIAILATVK
jgi:hypothetical protein